MKKRILYSFLFLFLIFGLSACGQKKIYFEYPDESSQESSAILNFNNLNNNMNQEILKQYSQAELETNLGNFTIEFFNEEAPITSANFLNLANDAYFDNIKFHRVIDGFMIQGGDPLTKDDSMINRWGTGGPGYAIEDEFSVFLSNKRGTISMANSGPNTGGSQFFINLVDNNFLDFKHAVFGKVIDGMEIVDKIGKVKTGPSDRPENAVIIKKINLK